HESDGHRAVRLDSLQIDEKRAADQGGIHAALHPLSVDTAVLNAGVGKELVRRKDAVPTRVRDGDRPHGELARVDEKRNVVTCFAREQATAGRLTGVDGRYG